MVSKTLFLFFLLNLILSGVSEGEVEPEPMEMKFPTGFKALDCEDPFAEMVEIPNLMDCDIYHPKYDKEGENIAFSIWELDKRRFEVRGFICTRRFLEKTCEEGFVGQTYYNEKAWNEEISLEECGKADFMSDPVVFPYECYWMVTKVVRRDWIEKVPFVATMEHATGNIFIPQLGIQAKGRSGKASSHGHVASWDTEGIRDFDPKCNHIKKLDTTGRMSNYEERGSELVRIVSSEQELVVFVPQNTPRIDCVMGSGKEEHTVELYQSTSGIYVSVDRDINVQGSTTSSNKTELEEEGGINLMTEARLAEVMSRMNHNQTLNKKELLCRQRNHLISDLRPNMTLTEQQVSLLFEQTNKVGRVIGAEILVESCYPTTLRGYNITQSSNILVETMNGKVRYYNPYNFEFPNDQGARFKKQYNRTVNFLDGKSLHLETSIGVNHHPHHVQPVINSAMRLMRGKNNSEITSGWISRGWTRASHQISSITENKFKALLPSSPLEVIRNWWNKVTMAIQAVIYGLIAVGLYVVYHFLFGRRGTNIQVTVPTMSYSSSKQDVRMDPHEVSSLISKNETI